MAPGAGGAAAAGGGGAGACAPNDGPWMMRVNSLGPAISTGAAEGGAEEGVENRPVAPEPEPDEDGAGGGANGEGLDGGGSGAGERGSTFGPPVGSCWRRASGPNWRVKLPASRNGREEGGGAT